MNIDISSLSRGPRDFDYTLEPGWWGREEEGGQILGLSGPLNVHIRISRAGTKYLVDGRLKGRLVIRCDRCLEPYQRDLDSEFSFFLKVAQSLSGQKEIELLEDDILVEFVMGSEIRLDDIVREQIYLSLPMKCLCSEDCSGLCPVCGANLNLGECECLSDKGHPGFLKLKKVKFQGE
jgi:uncharacterized protein